MTPPALMPLPLVGLPSDSTRIGAHPFQAVGEKYVRAITEVAGMLAVAIPSVVPQEQLPALLDRLDGLLLTGARSNIEPHHYSNEASYPGNLHDPSRDATTLNLIPLAIERRLPVLAVCRGLQEVNVALGGTLYQKVQDVPGFSDHREREGDPLEVQYGPAHAIELAVDGILAQIAGGRHVMVNSLHGQGIRTLAPETVVEALAEDGLIEAFRLGGDDCFLLAVQWHPEWRAAENPFYTGIFKRFAAACRDHAALRHG
jgi:putative glutamine amidotransferase